MAKRRMSRTMLAGIPPAAKPLLLGKRRARRRRQLVAQTKQVEGDEIEPDVGII